MSGRNIKIFITIFVLFFSLNVEAISPAQPILPSDNIQDPGSPSTPWGGCTPTDTNCYVTTSNNSAFSENVTGLEYSTSTGLMLTAGYTIPTFASTTAWDNLLASSTNNITRDGNSFGSALVIGTNDSNSLSFKTNNTNQLTIATNGNVTINNGTLSGPGWTIDQAGTFTGTSSKAGAIVGTANSDFGGYNVSNVGALSATSLALTNGLSVASGGTGASSFASGRILFGNGTGALNSTSTLFWDNANGRLGIGNASPNAKLDVSGQTLIGSGDRVQQSTFPLYISDSSSLGWKVADSNGNSKFELYAGFGGTNEMRLLNSVKLIGYGQDLTLGTQGNGSALTIKNNAGGFIGIGTTTPGSMLTVVGTSTYSGLATFNSGVNVGSQTFTSLLGSGLANIAGSLSVSTSTIQNMFSVGAGLSYAAGVITNIGVNSLAGTANQITVSNATGTVTLSLPQNINTSATPTFASTTLSNFTAGSIPFIGTGGALSQNNSSLFWDATNSRLGVGSSTPSAKLDVAGNATIGSDLANYLSFVGSATNPSISVVGSSANADLLLKPKGSGQVIVGNGGWTYNTQSSGAGSILFNNGTSDSPNLKFAYANNNNFAMDSYQSSTMTGLSGQVLRFIKNSDETGGAEIGAVDANGNFGTIGNANFKGTGNSSFLGNLGIGTTTPGSKLDVWGNFNVGTSSTPVLFANSATGNVGIGTSNPGYKLEVNGLTQVNNTIRTYDSGSNAYLAINPAYGSGPAIQVITAHPLIFATSNSERARLTATGDWGLGTTTPGAKLDVWGSLRVGTSSSPVLFADAGTGNLAIGTTTAPSALSILASKAGAGLVRLQNTGGTNSYAAMDLYDTSGNQTGGFGYANSGAGAYADKLYYYSIGKDINFGHSAGGSDIAINGSTGYVGIGTTTPSTYLHVRGNTTSLDFVRISAGATGQYSSIGFYDNLNAQMASFGYGGSTVGGSYQDKLFFNTVGKDIVFGTNGNQRYTFTSGGNLGIGTTTPFGKLALVGAAGNAGISANIYNTDATGYSSVRFGQDGQAATGGTIHYFNSSWNAGTSAAYNPNTWNFTSYGTGGYSFVTNQAAPIVYYIGGITASSEKMRIDTNGNLGIGTSTPGQKLVVAGNAQFTGVGSGAYGFDLNLTSDGTLTTSASDQRLKDNIMLIDSTSTLEKINMLKPSTFTWKSDGSHDLGLIAQEVQQVFPELVFTNPSDGYLGINYSRFTPLLIAGIQELSHKVDAVFAWFKDGTFNVQSDVCVDDVCVTKDQFKNMLRNAQGSQQANVVHTYSAPAPTPTEPTVDASPTPDATPTPEITTPDPAPVDAAPAPETPAE